MPNQRCCDICGRTEGELSGLISPGSPLVEFEDGLWLCRACRVNLVQPSVGIDIFEENELQALVGKSAGAICHTLNLPYEHPFQSVIDAASKIAYDEDSFMSAWAFVTQWTDSTTVWRAEDGETIAVVPPDGSIQINQVT